MDKPTVNLYLFPEKEIKEYYKEYKSDERNDCGYDLYTSEDVVVEPFDVGTLNFKIKCEAKIEEVIEHIEMNENVSYLLMPRSSISNTPLVMCNSIGLIDSGYRGYIMAKVRNLSSGNYTVRKGTRLFQLVPINNGRGWSNVKVLEEEKLLSNSLRGEGGFGSTGK